MTARRNIPASVTLAVLFGLAGLISACGDAAAGPGTASGSLEVSVVVDGWALPNVEVLVEGPGGAATASSGLDGVALFTDLAAGVYTMVLDGVDPDARIGDLPEVVVALDERTRLEIPGEFDPGRFVDVRVGGTFQCALNESGNAYCWGLGGNGELGNGGQGVSGRPVRVRAPVRLSALAAGSIHACALGTGGTAYCWGSNSAGRLGRGVTSSELPRSATPERVAGGVRFSALDAAAAGACGVEIGTGRGYCWGSSQGGLLGSPGPTTELPRGVASQESFAMLTSNDAWAGDEAVSALTTDGRVFFWGALRFDGGPSWMSFAGVAPTEVPLPARARLISPSCAILIDDRVMCWPDLQGDDVPPEVLERLVPTSEPGLHEYLVEGLDAAFFRAGLPCMRRADGYVCLQDWFLELPVLDFDGETAIAVASRGYAGCAVTEPGRVWCWNLLDFEPRLHAGPGSER